MRGAPGPDRRPGCTGGIIPADAGSTSTPKWSPKRVQDHPRGCGEHLITPHEIRCRLGSSPRMRGAPTCWPCRTRRLRIIPADAGSTVASTRRSGWYTDHPRGCGEHIDHSVRHQVIEGSSPRMRGAPISIRARSSVYRIIPADVGSTGKHGILVLALEDHPRGCGEHDHYGSVEPVTEGSSPRMRGALAMALAERNGGRIIPADAGSTCPVAGKCSRLWDHPRGCGEHS